MPGKSKYSFGLEGKRFGRWTIVSFAYSRQESAKSYAYHWTCRCDCGIEKIVNARILYRGKSTSCGCYKNELDRTRTLKHGYLRNKINGNPKRRYEQNSWAHMKDRIDNPDNNHYHRYGGRGIKACIGMRDFANFLKVMGHRPTIKHSIDRANNDGHYSCGSCSECLSNLWPMNCRWATAIEQARNRSQHKAA